MTRRRVLEFSLALALACCCSTAVAGAPFTPGKSYAVGTNPAYAALGDFNHDGKLDVAVANVGSNNVSILLGTGDGTFRPAVNYPAGSAPALLVTGDFNGDGNLDLAVANLPTGAPSSICILLGNGDGTFQAPIDAHAGNPSADLPVAADINGDGKADLAVTSRDSSGNPTLSVYLSSGNGTFQLIGAPYPIGSPTVGDFNGDKKLDFAVLQGTVGPTVYLGNGDGTFQPAITSSISLTNITSLRLGAADFNRDGRTDLVWAVTIPSRFGFGQPSTYSVRVVFSNGDGTFGPPATYATGVGRLTCCTVADFNGDGVSDVVVEKPATSTTAASLWVFQNNGDGTFAASSSNFAPLPLQGVAGDIDGDGKADMLVLDSVNNTITPLLTNPPTGLPCALSTVSPSVTICTPDNNATLASPVHLIAGATDTNPVVRMEAWVDGVKQVTQLGARLDTFLPLPDGTHRIAAVAAEADGTYFLQAVMITVNSTTPAPTVQLTATPAVITAGQSSTLSWTSTNATGVAIQPGPGFFGPSGTLIVQPTVTTTYTANATGTDGSTVSSSATVTVLPAGPCPLSTVNRTVTICTPSNNATVTSPVRLLAGATDSTPVIRMEGWIDGVKRYTQLGNSLDTSLSLDPGTHRVTIVAAESDTSYYSSVIFITVQAASTGCTISTVDHTVTICTPSDGATVTSPFKVIAGSSDTTGTVVRMEVWIDGVKISTQFGNSLLTTVSPPPGPHRLVVVAAESDTSYFLKAINITVSP